MLEYFTEGKDMEVGSIPAEATDKSKEETDDSCFIYQYDLKARLFSLLASFKPPKPPPTMTTRFLLLLQCLDSYSNHVLSR